MTIQQEQKNSCKPNRRQPIVRQYKTSADKKEHFDGTILKLIDEITLLPLINTIVGAVLIRGKRLKEDGAKLCFCYILQ